jgi:hypothetical protein
MKLNINKVIRSLRFHTNRTKYGPYGWEKGKQFSFPMEGGVIVGFHGRADEFVDAIGVYLKPFIPFCASSPGYTMHQEVWSL